jgi:hypothetical protein
MCDQAVLSWSPCIGMSECQLVHYLITIYARMLIVVAAFVVYVPDVKKHH